MRVPPPRGRVWLAPVHTALRPGAHLRHAAMTVRHYTGSDMSDHATLLILKSLGSSIPSCSTLASSAFIA